MKNISEETPLEKSICYFLIKYNLSISKIGLSNNVF